MNQPYKSVHNRDTGETYRATPSDLWDADLARWCAAMRDCGHNVATCPVPSPMPPGHIMFLRSPKRRPAIYQPID